MPRYLFFFFFVAVAVGGIRLGKGEESWVRESDSTAVFFVFVRALGNTNT